MRVLIYTDTFLPQVGGAELVVHNLAEGLAQNGHEVLVAIFQHAEPNPVGGYELLRLRIQRGAGRFRLTSTARRARLLKLIWAWKPDVVHAHFSIPCGLDMRRVAAFIRVPWVLTCHGEDIQKHPEIPYGHRLDPHKESQIGQAVRGADGLIAISQDIRKEYLSLGADSKKIHDLANPIAFETLVERNDEARHHLDLPSDIPVVLAVGRNHPKKGFRHLLDAAAVLRDREVKIQLVFVGEGCGALKTHAQGLGLVEQVHVFETATPAGLSFARDTRPPSQPIETFFQAADIYAMPSLVESFGLVTVEAMAAGLPIVAFEGPGTNDLLKGERCGALIRQGDIAAYADCLERFSVNRNLRKQLGDCGKQIAARYDRRIVARRHVDLYKSIHT